MLSQILKALFVIIMLIVPLPALSQETADGGVTEEVEKQVDGSGEVRQTPPIFAKETISFPSPQIASSIDEPYSPRLALHLSLWPTVIGTVSGGIMGLCGIVDDSQGLVVAGFIIGHTFVVIGPSIGHFYAHNFWWGLGSIGLRGLAVSLVWAGAGLIAVSGINDTSPSVGIVITAIGTLSLVGLAIYDIATAKRAARQANEKAAKRKLEISFTPSPTSDGGALFVVGRF